MSTSTSTPPPTAATQTPTPPRPTPRSKLARTAWFVPGAILAVLLLGYGTLAAVGLSAFERQTVRLVVPEPVATIELDVEGSSRVLGEDRDDVLVEARLTRGLTSPRHREEVVGDRLVLWGDCPALSFGWCDVSYTVRVPTTVDVVVRGAGSGRVEGIAGGVDVDVRGGGLALADIDGAVDARTDGGSVTATDVRGLLRLRTGGGSIDGRSLSSPTVVAATSGGSVELRFATDPQRVDATTGGGGIRIEVPDGSATYAVDAETGGGGVDTSVRTDPASERIIRARSGGGRITISSTTGDR